ncbi:hypothetical protein CEXT_243621 [Caerostris extrusa]|uniref:Mos1 transposase HTH domain-containing protein n=1 Tax=Caerostris extrusa TaxID=172846 RepID=A0AAV4RXP6_CAEEX|nr:hypothetical protein CEXT_243621 [Caerostris extrusa]
MNDPYSKCSEDELLTHRDVLTQHQRTIVCLYGLRGFIMRNLISKQLSTFDSSAVVELVYCRELSPVTASEAANRFKPEPTNVQRIGCPRTELQRKIEGC